jgi:hypothetical protein
VYNNNNNNDDDLLTTIEREIDFFWGTISVEFFL